MVLELILVMMMMGLKKALRRVFVVEWTSQSEVMTLARLPEVEIARCFERVEVTGLVLAEKYRLVQFVVQKNEMS